jgi:hypothetical protein
MKSTVNKPLTDNYEEITFPCLLEAPHFIILAIGPKETSSTVSETGGMVVYSSSPLIPVGYYSTTWDIEQFKLTDKTINLIND